MSKHSRRAFLGYHFFPPTNPKCDLIPVGFHNVAGLPSLGPLCPLELDPVPLKGTLERGYVVTSHRLMWRVLHVGFL